MDGHDELVTIPDYLSFLERLDRGLVVEGGTILHRAGPALLPADVQAGTGPDRVAYLAWRVFQGDYGGGLATRLRRIRGDLRRTPGRPTSLGTTSYGTGSMKKPSRALLDTLFADVEIFATGRPSHHCCSESATTPR